MAYAALLSLSHTLEHSLNCDSRYLMHDEIQQMSFLLEMVRFSLDLLENSSQKCSEMIESVENRIRDRAYEAENTIESTVMNRVLEGSAGYMEMNFLTICHTLEKAIEDIDSIEKRMDKMEDESSVQDLRLRFSSLDVSSNPAASGIRKSDMMGLDDDMMKIKGRLTRRSSNFETVSLVGMGGIDDIPVLSYRPEPILCEIFRQQETAREVDQPDL